MFFGILTGCGVGAGNGCQLTAQIALSAVYRPLQVVEYIGLVEFDSCLVWGAKN